MSSGILFARNGGRSDQKMTSSAARSRDANVAFRTTWTSKPRFPFQAILERGTNGLLLGQLFPAGRISLFVVEVDNMVEAVHRRDWREAIGTSTWSRCLFSKKYRAVLHREFSGGASAKILKP